MAPAPQTIIEDEEEFLADVAAFHKRRGTTFDREGKVSGRPISLHKLYKLVIARGGYDALSAERMAWRTLVREFGIGKAHEAVMTFQLKTVYYKNLAAYEISTYWGEQPPPKEILEDISAKGGYLRTRTLENYPIPSSQTVEPAMVEGGDSAEEEQTTPKRAKIETEEPESATRYPSRQLRQDPKRTQIYQPDPQPTRSRSVRATDSPAAPAVFQQTYTSNSTDPRHPSFDWYDKYEPRPPIALTLRPAQTPGNDPHFFARKAQAQAAALPRPAPEPQQYLKPIIPTAMTGPDIYIRCLYCLRSGIPEQQQFALHHMVKMSFERGDKYKFETYPFLAEGLIEKALEITELVHGVKWEISYDDDAGDSLPNTLNAAFGTSNLLARVESLMPKTGGDDLEGAGFADKLERLNEAVLVLRNMVILEDNAGFLSKMPLFKDFLTIALSIPDRPKLAEFKRSALEVAEQVTRYWPLASDDPLYLTLVPLLNSNDRAVLLPVLRSINRFGILTAEIHNLTKVPLASIERLLSFTVVDSDEELLETTLTFIYEFTAVPENNTEVLSNNFQLYTGFISRLISLLVRHASVKEIPGAAVPVGDLSKKNPAVNPIPIIPQELYAHLLQFIEPDRSSRWLRCCFEESLGDDVTQIAIWQAYSSRFSQHNPVQAADFIKNVSNTFSTAQAQVINGPVPRFIIRGIKPRRVLLDLHSRPLFQCLWEVNSLSQTDPTGRSPNRHVCSSWHSTRERLWTHIMADHLRLPKDPKGGFTYPPARSSNFMCRWTRCSRRNPVKNSHEFSSHIMSHIPESPEAMAKLINELASTTKQSDRPEATHAMYQTPFDETGHPSGVSWMSVLILRNLARYANRHGAPFEKDGIRLNQKLFGGHRDALFRMVSLHRTLRDHLVNLIHMVEQADQRDQAGTKRDHEGEDVSARSG
ncbi:hypothetical protein A1O3_01643 [Capronia epimyces CBS 606.96]|uniref:ARID domain-containing protein n=1 Tax=Capronia epimyces CBS 606.96 TaxID=1182542 RepID=W9YJJ9_9EURO|nr:uncharacterized protein A1O3_01643 [Capronia epimyces CBS 606.96]EXJ93087.1 hypothetical protein A1O3_01643 [Capronia epimyces CBS 606.96]